MAIHALDRVIDRLRQAVRQDCHVPADAELLDSYVKGADADAFEALVRRHGPMVLGVCRRILRNETDAEDAFQATFLVLVRKAGSIRPRGMVSNWLYGVARNTALKAKDMIHKRRAREKQAAVSASRAQPRPEPAAEVWRDVQTLLDDELGQLPDKYRVPVVLCDLEGKMIKEAARHLGWPQGTLATRLARGRSMLARRLSSRGFTLSAAALTAMLSQGAASAGVPVPLVGATLKAAGAFAARQTAAGVISAQVAALTEGVLKTMLISKLKTMIAVLLILLATCFGGGLCVGRLTEAQQVSANDSFGKDRWQTAEKAKPDRKNLSDKEKLQGAWVKISEEFAGKPVAKEDVRPQWMFFEDDKIVVQGIDLRSGKPEKMEGTYALAPDKSPRTMEITGWRRVEGPRTKPPDDVKAIYMIEGDTLKLAIGKKGVPTQFKTEEGDGVVVVVLKREGGARKGKQDKQGAAPPRTSATTPVNVLADEERARETQAYAAGLRNRRRFGSGDPWEVAYIGGLVELWRDVLPLGQAQASAMTKLDTLLGEAFDHSCLALADYLDTNPPDFQEHLACLERRYRATVYHGERMCALGLLTEAQAALVMQRYLSRSNRLSVLADPKVQEVLGITAAQQKELVKVGDEATRRELRLNLFTTDPDELAFVHKKMAENVELAEEAAMNVFTPGQRKLWSDLVAERKLPAEPPNMPAPSEAEAARIKVRDVSPVFRKLAEKADALKISDSQKKHLQRLEEITRQGLFWISLRNSTDAAPEALARVAQARAEFVKHAEQVALFGILTEKQAEQVSREP